MNIDGADLAHYLWLGHISTLIWGVAGLVIAGLMVPFVDEVAPPLTIGTISVLILCYHMRARLRMRRQRQGDT